MSYASTRPMAVIGPVVPPPFRAPAAAQRYRWTHHDRFLPRWADPMLGYYLVTAIVAPIRTRQTVRTHSYKEALAAMRSFMASLPDGSDLVLETYDQRGARGGAYCGLRKVYGHWVIGAGSYCTEQVRTALFAWSGGT